MGMGRAVGGAMQNQMGGMGGKGKGGAAQQPQVQQPQGGFGGKGGQQQQNPYTQQYYQPQFQPDTFNNPYAQGGFGQQMGGMGGKGGQMGNMNQPQVQQPQGGMGGKGGPIQQYLQQRQGGMGGKGGQQVGPDGRPLGAPGFSGFDGMNKMGGMGGPMSGYRQQMQQRRMADMMRGQPSGLAALAQPTATTQAATPAPEQPYMGNYLS